MKRPQPKHAFRPPTGHRRPIRRGCRAVVVVTATVGALAASVVAGASASPRTAATIGAAASAGSATTTAKPQAAAGGKIYFGVDGTVSTAANGMNLARHVYGQLGGSVPNARMVTMGTSGLSYSQIAGAQPGSSTYANIVRWADTIKDRGTLTFFGFQHEPESKDQARFGSASQYIAAYRHVADIIRAQNVDNVKFVWQVTAFAFRRTDSKAAIHYYPGDNYVDDVGADPYNWGDCRGGDKWVQLSTVTDPVLAFARAHGRQVVLAEFGSDSGSGRAAWLDSAHQYLIANRDLIRAAFYFDRPPTTSAGAGCHWSLTSGADVAAFRAIVDDSTYFTS